MKKKKLKYLIKEIQFKEIDERKINGFSFSLSLSFSAFAILDPAKTKTNSQCAFSLSLLTKCVTVFFFFSCDLQSGIIYKYYLRITTRTRVKKKKRNGKNASTLLSPSIFRVP